MTDVQMREIALDQAVRQRGEEAEPAKIVAAAEEFFKFLNEGADKKQST